VYCDGNRLTPIYRCARPIRYKSSIYPTSGISSPRSRLSGRTDDRRYLSQRGDPGHPHTPSIHMNGRAYDYNLGRFLSVDPVIQFPANSQSLNPYSYILNNPLSGTDPSGYVACSASDGRSGNCGVDHSNYDTRSIDPLGTRTLSGIAQRSPSAAGAVSNGIRDTSTTNYGTQSNSQGTLNTPSDRFEMPGRVSQTENSLQYTDQNVSSIAEENYHSGIGSLFGWGDIIVSGAGLSLLDSKIAIQNPGAWSELLTRGASIPNPQITVVESASAKGVAGTIEISRYLKIAGYGVTGAGLGIGIWETLQLEDRGVISRPEATRRIALDTAMTGLTVALPQPIGLSVGALYFIPGGSSFWPGAVANISSSQNWRQDGCSIGCAIR
jgi:RHS repeat-associated protein